MKELTYTQHKLLEKMVEDGGSHYISDEEHDEGKAKIYYEMQPYVTNLVVLRGGWQFKVTNHGYDYLEKFDE